MSVFGIVCETNPCHNGHKHLITSARKLGADAVVCVMSGNTVQRGEFAIADKYLRAEALLKCGADLVLELPFPWSSSSAEFFARASVYILSKFCDTIIFGSECGSIDTLEKAASLANSAEFKEEYNSRITSGEGSAAVYFDMLGRSSGVKFSSNDLLGIEYIKAIKALSLDLNYKTIKRLGDNYTSLKMSNNTYPSAMSIRKLWQEGNTENIEEYIPTEAVDVYLRAIQSHDITDLSRLDTLLLTFFRTHSGSDFEDIVGASGGLANRICEMSHRAKSAEELLNLVKTKRYTDSGIKRTMLYCMAGVKKEHIEALPCETLLLSANQKGRALLSNRRKLDDLRVCTKPADLTQGQLSNKIDALYTLLRKDILQSDNYIKKSPFIT